ncbi:hypothetical protein ACX40Y_02080 [Sphingomonas sp. RS6]
MLSTTSASPKNRLRVSLRGRGAAVLLALAVEVLIALLLLWMSPVIQPPKKPGSVVFGINVSSGDEAAAKAETKTPEPARKPAGARAEQPQPQPPTPELPPPPVVPPVPNGPPSFIVMSRNDYAASDIARAPATPSGAEGDRAATASADAGGEGDTPRAGTGPNGEPLYAADWYRRPNDRQLSPYISARSLGRDGWGEVACRTVARYQVVDCQELGEYPAGSGYAGSVRQAAFQFLVKPPRVGGKALIGSWVRIRITYTRQGGGE